MQLPHGVQKRSVAELLNASKRAQRAVRKLHIQIPQLPHDVQKRSEAELLNASKRAKRAVRKLHIQ